MSDRVVIDGDTTLTSTIDGESGAYIRLGQTPVIETLNVTESGTYEAPDGVDGFNPVRVDIPEGYSDNVDDFNGGNILALISHKNEYIDTGYYPKVCTEYYLKATKDKQYLRYENLFATLFESVGTRAGIEMYASSLTNISYYTTSSSTFPNVPSSLSADVPTILSTRHLLSADPNTVATRPLLIFYGYHNTGLDVKSGFNFFGLKCYECGKLIKKYVPWLDNNNVPCVRELVNDEYLYNAGTGAFGYIDLEGNIHDVTMMSFSENLLQQEDSDSI